MPPLANPPPPKLPRRIRPRRARPLQIPAGINAKRAFRRVRPAFVDLTRLPTGVGCGVGVCERPGCFLVGLAGGAEVEEDGGVGDCGGVDGFCGREGDVVCAAVEGEGGEVEVVEGGVCGGVDEFGFEVEG